MSEKREATYQDVLDAPENMIAELIDGELILSPRPGGPHTSVASMLGAELIPPFCHGSGGGPGGWIILDEPELHLGTGVLVPDLAGWHRSRMPQVPEGASFTVVPDWVCEVASKSTEKLDRKRKLPIYAAAGVRHLWLIQPKTRSVDIMRLQGGKWLLIDVHSDGDKVRAEPFDDVEIDLAKLWFALPTKASELSAMYGELEY
ncbi:MAG: Uma2 family endonuclease [Deltaproteobacteria bacterium]|nr:Uma2 family endonuclease [Deltaproteobacteria bacterium]